MNKSLQFGTDERREKKGAIKRGRKGNEDDDFFSHTRGGEILIRTNEILKFSDFILCCFTINDDDLILIF